jgi:hypothetical protein
VRGRLTVSGSSLVVNSAPLVPDDLCFQGASPGTTDLTIDWGPATVTRTWQVVAR